MHLQGFPTVTPYDTRFLWISAQFQLADERAPAKPKRRRRPAWRLRRAQFSPAPC